METSLTDRVVLSVAKRRRLDGLALCAVMKANELFGLALGVRLAKLRDSDELLQSAFAESEVQALQARLFHETSQILAERWDKIPDRRRPQYRPELRYRILRLKKMMAWSCEETAAIFRGSSGTITRWEQETKNHPERETVGSLVKPCPPVRRYADVVRQIVRSMDLAGFGGNRRIAQTLARAGWKIAKDTVRRVRKETSPKPTETPTTNKICVVKARYPNHIFMADLTEVPGLFRIFQFKLAAVIDVFSRMPLATRIFFSEPNANAIADLFREAVERFGAPRHFISDQGSQFTAKSFRDFLNDLDVRQRFGAIGKTGSIALIERLWRSIKDISGVRVFKPLALEEFERRLRLSLTYYAFFRPHQGLGGATPAEVYYRLPQTHLTAVQPPRGRPGETDDRIVFRDRLSRQRENTSSSNSRSGLNLRARPSWPPVLVDSECLLRRVKPFEGRISHVSITNHQGRRPNHASDLGFNSHCATTGFLFFENIEREGAAVAFHISACFFQHLCDGRPIIFNSQCVSCLSFGVF